MQDQRKVIHQAGKDADMTRASRAFGQTRQAILQDPQAAALYLEEALEAGDTEAFKLALRNVAEARLGGISGLAKETDLNREALYRTLSERGNPTLDSLSKILRALGLRVSVGVAATPGLLPDTKSPAAS